MNHDTKSPLLGTAEQPHGLLVFPVTVEAGLEIPELIIERDEKLVLASSVLDCLDLGEVTYSVTRLPIIYAGDFESAFTALTAKFNVRRVYCPVASVFGFLNELIAKKQLPLMLIGGAPQQRAIDAHRNLYCRGLQLFSFASQCCDSAALRQPRDLVALLLQAREIYGETSEEKIAGLYAAMSNSIPGDVVEIGVFMGRSAFALGFLARLFGIGPVLAVDPWRRDAAVQHDSPPVVQAMADACSFDDAFEVFLTNMHLLSRGSVNSLRMDSRQAIGQYGPKVRIDSADFGCVEYFGTISLLHIDGNHDYEEVLVNCILWLPRLGCGGWLVLDDYVWAHGEGPRRVGDDIVRHCAPDIEQAFVCGKSLFLRFTSLDFARGWAESVRRRTTPHGAY